MKMICPHAKTCPQNMGVGCCRIPHEFEKETCEHPCRLPRNGCVYTCIPYSEPISIKGLPNLSGYHSACHNAAVAYDPDIFYWECICTTCRNICKPELAAPKVRITKPATIKMYITEPPAAEILLTYGLPLMNGTPIEIAHTERAVEHMYLIAFQKNYEMYLTPGHPPLSARFWFYTLIHVNPATVKPEAI